MEIRHTFTQYELHIHTHTFNGVGRAGLHSCGRTSSLLPAVSRQQYGRQWGVIMLMVIRLCLVLLVIMLLCAGTTAAERPHIFCEYFLRATSRRRPPHALQYDDSLTTLASIRVDVGDM